MREDYKMDRLARLYLNEIVAMHDVPISIIFDHNSRFTRGIRNLVRHEYDLPPSDRWKKGKLAPKFIGPFDITKRIGPVSYRLGLPKELNGVHDTFHVLNLRKCLADPTLQIPLDDIRVDAKWNFVEEPVKILDRESKKLKRSRIVIVKVRWNSKRGPEFMWEREDQMKLNYSYLFSSITS
uniref:Putative reverse transcriptase domain-containing protein n=1 Tax=Tanacetum cinerariifolium TaxID=118510 RepID=A0A699IPM0_TANCI|nr:putative reverse transcriptase domain-containing protein [Tanacetum cinerariifolium]